MQVANVPHLGMVLVAQEQGQRQGPMAVPGSAPGMGGLDCITNTTQAFADEAATCRRNCQGASHQFEEAAPYMPMI